MNYLSHVKRDAEAMEKFSWLAFQLKSNKLNQDVIIISNLQDQKSKQIKPDDLSRIDNWLKTQSFIEGVLYINLVKNNLTESDVIAYIKLKKGDSLDSSNAIREWSKIVGKQVDSIVG